MYRIITSLLDGLCALPSCLLGLARARAHASERRFLALVRDLESYDYLLTRTSEESP